MREASLPYDSTSTCTLDQPSSVHYWMLYQIDIGSIILYFESTSLWQTRQSERRKQEGECSSGRGIILECSIIVKQIIIMAKITMIQDLLMLGYHLKVLQYFVVSPVGLGQRVHYCLVIWSCLDVSSTQNLLNMFFCNSSIKRGEAQMQKGT